MSFLVNLAKGIILTAIGVFELKYSPRCTVAKEPRPISSFKTYVPRTTVPGPTVVGEDNGDLLADMITGF
jgi:hypothetical protein